MKIIKDDSTRSLFANELMRGFRLRPEEKTHVFENKFDKFVFPIFEVLSEEESK